MWNVAVMAILVAVAGVYATRNAQTLDDAQATKAVSMAADMAIYRNAVVDYFTATNIKPGVASKNALVSGNYLPAWSRMTTQTTPLMWNNYRDAAGIIYIYATELPKTNLTGELASLAQNSILFGTYDSTTNRLWSPTAGSTNIPTTSISSLSIPNGAPVWLAMIK